MTLSPDTITEKNKNESEDILTFADVILDNETLHFVNNDADLTFFDFLTTTPVTYYGMKMSREKKTESMDMTIQTLKVAMDNVDQALSYYATKNLRNRRVVIRGCFRNLISDSVNAFLIFDGFLNNPHWTDKSFTAELFPRLGRGTLDSKMGIRQQLPCRLPFAIAGGRCARDIAAAVLKDEKTTQTVDSGTADYVIDAARTEANDYWNFGYLTFADDTLTVALRGVVREIQDFIAADHKVLFKIGLSMAVQAGDTYKIERGCDRSLDSCINKFNNGTNYGGIHTLPSIMVNT